VLQVGGRPVRAWLICHDGLEPEARETLSRCGRDNALEGPLGPVPWEVLDRSTFNRDVLLNYVFALVEAEGILACQAVGLDPGLGIVHNDARAPQSMALDLMEPVRPEVEAFVLDMLEGRTFRKVEFAEAPDGHVRLRAPLTHELAETIPRWARSLAPIAEKVANLLGHAMEGKYTPVTPLTSAKSRNAQAIVKARKAEAVGRATRDTAKQRPAAPAAPPLYSCPQCGGPVANPRHVLCETCQAGAGHTAQVRQTRGRAIAARKRALKERLAAFGPTSTPPFIASGSCPSWRP
jgi:hypothetical protein